MDSNLKGFFGSVNSFLFGYIGLVDALNLANLLLAVLGGFFSLLLVIISILEKTEKAMKVVKTVSGGLYEFLSMNDKMTTVKPMGGTDKEVMVIPNDRVESIYDHVEPNIFQRIRNVFKKR